jgi:hypothetical protein
MNPPSRGSVVCDVSATRSERSVKYVSSETLLMFQKPVNPGSKKLRVLRSESPPIAVGDAIVGRISASISPRNDGKR